MKAKNQRPAPPGGPVTYDSEIYDRHDPDRDRKMRMEAAAQREADALTMHWRAEGGNRRCQWDERRQVTTVPEEVTCGRCLRYMAGDGIGRGDV